MLNQTGGRAVRDPSRKLKERTRNRRQAISSSDSDARDASDVAPSSLRRRMGDLLIKVAEHDEVAFADLLTLMGPRVDTLCTRMVLNEQVGREITQDVFLEIWQKAHTFDGALGNPDTWVTMIALRRATDRARSEDRAKRHEMDYLTRMYTRDYDHTSETALDLVEQQRVGASLQHLSPAQAHAITLAFYEGLTYGQVAAQLGIPLATVKSRIRDALIILRRIPSLSGLPAAPPNLTYASIHAPQPHGRAGRKKIITPRSNPNP